MTASGSKRSRKSSRKSLGKTEIAAALSLPAWSKYIPHAPTPRQHGFLWLTDREVLYGGAAGGGKSDALLMAGLQYVDQPDYAGIILRRTYQDLAKSGALMDRARSWLAQTDAHWQPNNKTWEFPSGAKLEFGYVRTDADLNQYQSAEYQFIGIDELTQFTRYQYIWLFNRLRRLEGSQVPIRMRAGTNPGGVGHEWVKERWRLGSQYTERPPAGRRFLPALLDDNPFLDQEAYLEALGELDPILYAQLRAGNWDVVYEGTRFKRVWFPVVDHAPSGLPKVRYWDLASTAEAPGVDPDWTVGLLLSRHGDGQLYVEDVTRMRGTSADVDKVVADAAARDGKQVQIVMEQEPGAAGKRAIDYFRRQVLQGFKFRADRVTGSKELRAHPVSSSAQHGDISLVRGDWNEAFLNELGTFPMGEHDDQVDAFSGAFKAITGQRRDIQGWKIDADLYKQPGL